jgi:hypothetical protein
MPNTRTAPRRAARRIARKRLRESGEQIAAASDAGHSEQPTVAQPAAATFGPGWAGEQLLDEDEREFCTGCSESIGLKCNLRHRAGRVYCPDCVDLPLPTHAEMLAFLSRAFDVVGTVARSSSGQAVGEAVLAYINAQPGHELEGFGWDVWENIADVWERLAYRPVGAV